MSDNMTRLLARQNIFSKCLKLRVFQNPNWVLIFKRMIKENLAIALNRAHLSHMRSAHNHLSAFLVSIGDFPIQLAN